MQKKEVCASLYILNGISLVVHLATKISSEGVNLDKRAFNAS